MKVKKKQEVVKKWFVNLQNIVCKNIEQLEKDFGSNAKFKINKWKFGEYRVIKGRVIEKGGVAFSNVVGKFPKKFAKKIPGTKNNSNFWSSGVSVILHPRNPKVPAIHFNTRFICTKKNWFGGGIDLTPSLIDKNEKKKFHSKLKKMCDLHNQKYYSKYKKWCDKYFFLPHRNEPRGIGGIFFDYKMDNWEKDFLFVKHAGYVFNEIIHEVISKKMFLKWSKKQKEIQAYKRGRYVEFNLLYDRGTKFGLNSGGNPNAILVSLPPSPKWK